MGRRCHIIEIATGEEHTLEGRIGEIIAGMLEEVIGEENGAIESLVYAWGQRYVLIIHSAK